MNLLRSTPLCALAAVIFSSCATQKQPQFNADGTPFNPHPPGTLEHFRAEPDYRKTLKVWANHELLKETHAGNSHLRIDLASQRGFLMNGEQVVMDYPICSGTSSRPTPKGTFKIMEKVVDKSSNRYGKIYDATGILINGDADAFSDPIPEGGKFVGAPMRYWMRLTSDGVGHHIGPMPRSRRPSSHACVRGPSQTIPVVFSKVKVGTKVVIE